MKEHVITPLEQGQKLSTYLSRILPQAKPGFLYKMLRKKNITLNGKKASGHELLQSGDTVRIFFSDETYAVFSAEGSDKQMMSSRHHGTGAPEIPVLDPAQVLYEDEQILLINKPVGVLTQKAHPDDVSLNEQVIAYLLQTGQTNPQQLQTVRPSVCNRLDRNTSGIVAVGKTISALQALSALFAGHALDKRYRCIVCSEQPKDSPVYDALTKKREEGVLLEGFLTKDTFQNTSAIASKEMQGAKQIRTRYRLLGRSPHFLELEAQLLTGRSHQIRAQLSSEGMPILGDPKYGNAAVNRKVEKAFGLHAQLLHAYRVHFPNDVPEALSGVAGRTIYAPLPALYQNILDACFTNS